MTIPDNASPADIETEIKSEGYSETKPDPDIKVSKWIDTHKALVLGGVYLLFNLGIWIKYLIDWNITELWLMGTLVSIILLLLFFVQFTEDQPKLAKFALFFHMGLWGIALLFFFLSSQRSSSQGSLYYSSTLLIINGSLYLFFRLPPNGRLWLKSHRPLLVGGLYTILQILTFYHFITDTLSYHAGHPEVPENMSEIGLLLSSLPISLVFGFFFGRGVKANPSSTNYFFILPSIFGIVAYTFFPEPYFEALWQTYLLQAIVGLLFFLFAGRGPDIQDRMKPNRGNY